MGAGRRQRPVSLLWQYGTGRWLGGDTASWGHSSFVEPHRPLWHVPQQVFFLSVTADLELGLLPREEIHDWAWGLWFLLGRLPLRTVTKQSPPAGTALGLLGPPLTSEIGLALLHFARSLILPSKLPLSRFTRLLFLVLQPDVSYPHPQNRSRELKISLMRE